MKCALYSLYHGSTCGELRWGVTDVLIWDALKKCAKICAVVFVSRKAMKNVDKAERIQRICIERWG